MNAIRQSLRHKDALQPTLGATLYAFGGWLGGMTLLIVSSHWLLLAAGTLLLAHAMVIAAYMLHECAHQAVFRKREHNAAMGEVFSWISGGCYNSFDQIRSKHMHHHVDNADIVAFDYRGFLQRHPVLMRIMRALEWCYVPAVELMLHAMMVVAPFMLESRRASRKRVLLVLAVRGSLFVALAVLAPIAAVLYGVAYMLFMTVMRFMDAFQHNYELYHSLDQGGGSPHKGDKVYEQSHTFSNPVSMTYPWLNRLTLNFCYHNAHHEKPTVPWYRLPELHREYFGEDDGQVIPFREQLKAFHHQRIPRILSLEDESEDFRERMARGQGVGADGVSFLTAL
ncbi:MAG: fatty acid desaturase [Halomonadaceae bacterium]|nr:MAG: fatty acid desaturase [Halomonadaceae bacterium]